MQLQGQNFAFCKAKYNEYKKLRCSLQVHKLNTPELQVVIRRHFKAAVVQMLQTATTSGHLLQANRLELNNDMKENHCKQWGSWCEKSTTWPVAFCWEGKWKCG